MKDQIRQTQLVTSFGPGSMMDLPDTSVMIAGLEQWHYTPEERVASMIREPRLLARLAQRFKAHDLHLRRPPRGIEDPGEFESCVRARRFPTWYVAATDVKTKLGYIERRLVHRSELNNGIFSFEGKKVAIVPIRFVRACPNGHINDIEWNRLLHGGDTDCMRPKWVVEGGNAGDLDEVVVRCDCGKRVRMSDVADRSRNALGMCDGSRPWLGSRANEKCGIASQLLIRSASNAYFAERQTVISIPASSGGCDEQVKQGLLKLDELANQRHGLPFVRMGEPLKSILEGLSDAQVWETYDRLKSGVTVVARSVKDEEFEALATAGEEIGSDTPEGDFFARVLPKDEWSNNAWMTSVRRVVLVHRLRSVTALLGFTRFESTSTDIHGELDAEVRTAELARDVKWLPAVEARGEGIFIEFEPDAIAKWGSRAEVTQRFNLLLAGYEAWKVEHEHSHRKFAGLPYIMLHSLSHLLQTAISLECGYAASSLQERVYAIQETGKTGRFGILLYTAATDAQGTLGGLVEAGRAIAKHMKRALEGALLCSNDPVCSQHEPTSFGTAQLHGAACHGCILVSETSCEQQNDFLDRALVVPTVECSDAAFFSGFGA